MSNNDKKTQLYQPKHLSSAILQWLDQEIQEIYTNNKKKINLAIVTNDIFSQPFLAKFLLKINYNFFSKTQLMDFIDSTALIKLISNQRKEKFISFIQKYLYFHERRKFSQNYRYFLSSKNNYLQQKISHEIIRLILFISIRSDNKNQFILRIFNLTNEKQQKLMDQIMEIQSILENITEKQELALQLSFLQDLNKNMKNNYQQLVDYQNKLLNECEKLDSSQSILSSRNQSNINQKINCCQSLRIDDTQKKYLKIYKALQDKNATLNRILNQKKKKQNELLDKHHSLKQKSEEFQEVLCELNRQKKNLKIVLNDKKNESFHLQMRASLQFSRQKQNLRRSEAMKSKSIKLNNEQKDVSNNLFSQDGKKNLDKSKSKKNFHSEINHSVNILMKIDELKYQKQQLIKELTELKTENKQLEKKDHFSRKTFIQLKKTYQSILSLCPKFTSKMKQIKGKEAKPTLKTANKRYLEDIQKDLV